MTFRSEPVKVSDLERLERGATGARYHAMRGAISMNFDRISKDIYGHGFDGQWSFVGFAESLTEAKRVFIDWINRNP